MKTGVQNDPQRWFADSRDDAASKRGCVLIDELSAASGSDVTQMGTHPSGPSTLAGGGGGTGDEAPATTLKAALEAHPVALLGEAVHARWGAELPMLFKVSEFSSGITHYPAGFYSSSPESISA